MIDLAGLLDTALGTHIAKIVIAAVLIVLGALVAKALQLVFVKLLRLVKADVASEKIGMDAALRSSEISSGTVKLLGDAVFWVALLTIGLNIVYLMGFTTAMGLIRSILQYVTVNAVNAVFVVSLSVVLSMFLSGAILLIGSSLQVPGHKLIAKAAQYSVMAFGVIYGLDKLGVSTALIISKLDIILGFFALAGAIAFGLGCKDIAASFLASMLRGKDNY